MGSEILITKYQDIWFLIIYRTLTFVQKIQLEIPILSFCYCNKRTSIKLREKLL